MILTLLTLGTLIMVPFWLYLLLLTCFSQRGASDLPPLWRPDKRFCIVVPAHNEAAGIAATIRSLQKLDYPQAGYQLLVIADNCSDSTAQIAIDLGAPVMGRTHKTLRGKGYALSAAFDYLIKENEVDAVVVVDADTEVDKGLLQAFAAGLHHHQVMQAFYGVRNLHQSWRTQLMALAMGCFHRLRGLARERLQVSCGLRGNGMCFALPVLAKHPHRASSLVEDVEYGLELGLAGIRVAYIDAAKVYGDMAAKNSSAIGQRQRWEQGRRWLQRTKLWPLLRRTFRHPRWLYVDLLMDLMCPPLSTLVDHWTAMVTLLALWQWWAAPAFGWYIAFLYTIYGAQLLILLAYVIRGTLLSQLGWQGLWVLVWSPGYLLWKMSLGWRQPAKVQTWVRTERDDNSLR